MSRRLVLLLLMVFISSAILHSQITATDWIIYESEEAKARLGKSDCSSKALSPSYIKWSKLSELNKSFHDGRIEEQTIQLPLPDGSIESFTVRLNRLLPQQLSNKYPDIKSYTGRSTHDPNRKVYLDINHQGLHALITGSGPTIYIDPYRKGEKEIYGSYYRTDAINDHGAWRCGAEDHDDTKSIETLKRNNKSSTALVMRKYELAVTVSGEYTQFFGGTVQDGLAAVVTAINRVNSVYEAEVGVTLTLVPNNDQLIFVDPIQDPYLNNTSDIDTVNIVLNDIIGSGNYDVGHIFTTTLGGVATLGSICVDNSKGRGVTGLPDPSSDPFYIDYLSHELGHQFAGTHTFNGDSNNCGVGLQWSSITAYEPGSGSTIMAYAGICGNDDLQNNSDAYFHPASLIQITNHIIGPADVCSDHIDQGNSIPTSDANALSLDGKVIPASTPFILTGDGSDPDGDLLTYQWDQWDLGPQQDVSQGDNGSSPIFRSYFPSADKSRIFPRWSDLLNNTTAIGETLPTTDRDLEFTYVVRDNEGGWDDDQITISVVNAAGPFRITNLNSAINIWGTQSVLWNVAGTDANGINCSEVDISLIDLVSGNEILLQGNTPNDGSQTVAIPVTFLNQVRIKVQCSDNIFFDINNVDLSVAPTSLPCNVSSEITANPITDGIYSSDVELEASGLIPTQGSVIFTANNFVILNPNFEVEKMGTLEVYFMPCN